MKSFVMPAWMAGIQMRRMRPETSISAWIPAVHAGMTELRLTHPRIFAGAHEGCEGFIQFMILQGSV
jgi:hypothetical protein